MDEAMEQMGIRGYTPRLNTPFPVRANLGQPADDPKQMIAGLNKTVVIAGLAAFGIWYFLLRK